MQSRYTQCRTGILALMEPGRLLLWKVGAEAPAYGRWEPIRVPPTSYTLLRSSGVSGHQKAGNTETCLVNEIEGCTSTLLQVPPIHSLSAASTPLLSPSLPSAVSPLVKARLSVPFPCPIRSTWLAYVQCVAHTGL